jgi:hypothetical protein
MEAPRSKGRFRPRDSAVNGAEIAPRKVPSLQRAVMVPIMRVLGFPIELSQ